VVEFRDDDGGVFSLPWSVMAPEQKIELPTPPVVGSGPLVRPDPFTPRGAASVVWMTTPTRPVPPTRMKYMGIEFFMDLVSYLCWHSDREGWLEFRFLFKDELAVMVNKRLKDMGILEKFRTDAQERMLTTSLMALGDRIQLPKLTVNPAKIRAFSFDENPGVYRHLYITVDYDLPDAREVFDAIEHPEIIKGEL
jgi:hypothetical protein